MASKELIEGLNHALNREVATALRYMLQASVIRGWKLDAVRKMYEEEMNDEMGHASYLSNEIAMLGGTPKLDPDLSPPPSEVEKMLKNDIEQEKIDVEHYKKLAEMADKEGFVELKLKMEDQAADEQHHQMQMERLLG